MKKLLKRAGLEGKQTVFLFTDTQIVHETFLEVSASAACCISISMTTIKGYIYDRARA